VLGLFAILIPILVSDVINPVLLAAVIFALGSRKPYLNAVSILMGWLVVYFISGVLLVIGLDAIIDILKNPRPCYFVIEAIIGLLLIWSGIRLARSPGGKKKKKEFNEADKLNPLAGFGIGVSINLIGMPFAIPYFAVVDQILKANLSWPRVLMVLLIYNFLYILPFLILVVIRRISGQESDALFQKINDWMDGISSVLIPLIMVLLGGALIADAIVFFSSGKSLF
jgi:cytochrome c biogenesis protein CcdA